jgi:hypothetical protein
LTLTFVLSALLWPMVTSAAPNTPSDDDLIIFDDALTPPDVEQAAFNMPGLGGATLGAPGYYQTSDYMIGNVAVGLILPESNEGQEAQSEDWTDEEIAQVQAEVQDALAWWAGLEPAAHLTFTIESHWRVPIGYEPITHSLGEEKLWIGATMAALGFANDSYFGAVRDYVNDLRDRTGSDWAFVVFVADSSADADGRFADGYFAYAYVGGPFTVLSYDNSGYGIDNMDAVAAHEIGHIFRALDQYAAAGASCDYRAGYLSVKNGNSLAGGDCESDESSIMRGGIAPYLSHSIDVYARGQIGWWDSDGDGVLDPLDTKPELTVEAEAIGGENKDLFSFGGLAWQEPVPSPDLVDSTISRIAGVGAWVDKGSWAAATAQDGRFDTLSEAFHLQVGPLAPGLHTLEIQAVNSEGLVSTAFVTTTFVYDPVDGALNSSLTSGPAASPADRPIQFNGVATAAYGDPDPDAPTVAVVQFSVDGGAWQDATADDGQFDSCIENFDVALEGLPDGLHSLTIRALSSDGRVETSLEERAFQVRPTYTIFFPFVGR